MLIVICVVLLLVILICFKLESTESYYLSSFVELVRVVVTILFCLFLATTLIMTFSIAWDGAVHEKIEILREQNTEIEQKVNASVTVFLEHESITYDTMTVNDAFAYAVTIPQLASSELIKEQLFLYRINNEKLLSLLTIKAELKTKRFILYFGK